VLITAIGVSLFLENTGQLRWLFGTQPQPMPGFIIDRALVTFAGVRINLVDVMVVAVALALMIVLQWLVFGTKIGRAMRAVSFDTRTAALMGINVDAVVSVTFVIGSSLAAAAGLLFGLKYHGLKQPADTTWVLLGLKAFVAAVIGGIGNIRGAMVGGLLLGVLESLVGGFISSQFQDTFVFLALITVLLIRPQGLFGQPLTDRA